MTQDWYLITSVTMKTTATVRKQQGREAKIEILKYTELNFPVASNQPKSVPEIGGISYSTSMAEYCKKAYS